MEDKKWLVYIHTNQINGKKYVGITHHINNPNKRWRNGLGYKKYIGNQTGHFYNAIKKYGWDNFDHEIIETNLTREQASTLEIQLIEKYMCCEHEYGYNSHEGGSGGFPLSDQAKRKISLANSGERNGMYSIGERHPMYGKHHTLAARQKISQSNKGKVPWNKGVRGKFTDRQRSAVIATHTGNKYNLGRVWSEESKNKVSEKIRQKWEDTSYKQRMIDAHTGKQNDSVSKSVICNDIEFRTMTECAKFYGIKRETMGSWLRGKQTMPEKFFNMGLRWKNDHITYVKRQPKTHPNGLLVVCDNNIFYSIKMCADFYSLSATTLRRWLRGERKMPQKYIDLGLRYATEEDLKLYKVAC